MTQYFETVLHRRVLQRAFCAVSDGKTKDNFPCTSY